MSEFINSLIANWTVTVKAFAVLAAITLVIVTAIKTKGSWTAIIISLLTGGIVVWAVTMNGLGWFSERVGDETNASVQGVHLVDDAPASFADGHDKLVIYELAPSDSYALVS